MEGWLSCVVLHREIQLVPMKRLLRYFIVGGVAAIVDFLLFALLVQMTGWPWFWGGLVSFSLATAVNYVLSIRFVFSSGARFVRRQHEILLVFLVSLAGLGVNQAVLWFCIEKLSVNALIAKIIGTGIVFFWNYFSRRNFIFRKAASTYGESN